MVSGVDVPIELRNRIETFEAGITLERWQVLDRSAHKAVFERLHELQLVLNNRTAECDAGCKASDADESTATSTHPGKHALRIYNEFIRPGFCLYGRDCTGELTIFSSIGIGYHLN